MYIETNVMPGKEPLNLVLWVTVYDPENTLHPTGGTSDGLANDLQDTLMHHGNDVRNFYPWDLSLSE